MREIQSAHRRMADEAVSDAARSKYAAHAAAQASSIIGDALQGVRLIKNLQGLFRGGKGNRMGGVGTAVGDALADLAHDLFPARQDGYGVSVAHRLRERAKVRMHAVEFLHPAARDTKSGFDFIDEQHHAVAVTKSARRAQVFRFGCDAETIAHDGLDQQTSDAM